MKEYDGWILKSFMGRSPWIVPNSFRVTRVEIVKYWRELMGISLYRKRIREGSFKIVKVKLVEVSDD